MKLIVGLGNPGKKYEKTRHNVGFMVINALSSTLTISKKYNAEILEENIGEEKTMLVKPQTFMNESGVAIRKLMTDHGTPINDLMVIHDDVDLPFGTIRIKKGGGAGGHHGLESVIEKAGSNDFVRVRIGVGKSDVIPTEDFVLMPFSTDEAKQLPIIIKRAAHVVTSIMTDGLERTMNTFN